jgi:serine/threonine protein kinase
LLDEQGNVKLADFGWSISEASNERHTICGTLDYMAPEMCGKQKYGPEVDIWALGVLLYEMLHGESPFGGKDIVTLIDNIKNQKYQIDHSLSQSCHDLIRGLLRQDPSERFNLAQVM